MFTSESAHLYSRVRRWGWGLVLAWLILALPIALWDYSGRWHGRFALLTDLPKLLLFWACFAGLPVTVLLGFEAAWSRAVGMRLGALFACVCAAIGTWAHLVEPNVLLVRHSTIREPAVAQNPAKAALRVALVADIHLGMYLRAHQLQRLVDKLNTLEVDTVLVAGDWTYQPALDLPAAFAPLAQIRHPVFGVLGNHDPEKPGPALRAELAAALTSHRVQLMEGQAIDFKGWQLLGLDDLWGGEPKAQVERLMTEPHPRRMVLTHQPDTAALLPAGSAVLTLAGHTHGGQIMLPWLTERVLRRGMRNPWYRGRDDIAAGHLFVTTGIGTIGLPARLGVAPTIDVLDIKS